MKRIFYLLGTIFISINCALPATLFPALQTDPVDTSACANLEPTDADRDTILGYKKSLFSEEDWGKSYSVHPDQVIVIYTSDSLGAVAVIKDLILCDAVHNLKSYATEENIAVILSNYENYEKINSCEKDGTLLFQFDSFINEMDYNISLWISAFNDPNRALEVFLVFPKSDSENMRKYSQSLFPDFVSCE